MEDAILKNTIDHYYIEERIKAGGVAVVYKAIDRRDNRLVALKLLQSSWAEHDEVIERFNREARIMRQLQHPYIVNLYDFGFYQRRPYIVMDYMPGGSLSDQLKKTAQFRLEHTVHMIRQIASALDYAHNQRVIHRDIKPGNVLIRNEKVFALTDFGIARVIEGTMLTNTGHMPGTPHYMSPEQASGTEELTHSSDIYSLGVIAYLLCTGKLPFGGTDALVIINQHLHAAPPKPRLINSDIPPALEKVLMRVMEKKPSNRYSTAGEFANAFMEASLGHENMVVHLKRKRDEDPGIQRLPSSVIPQPNTQTPSKPIQVRNNNNKALIGFTVLIALFIIGGIILALSARGEDKGGVIVGLPSPTATSEPTEIEAPTEQVVLSPQPTETETETPTEEVVLSPSTEPEPTATEIETATATESPTETPTDPPTPTEATEQFTSLTNLLETMRDDTGNTARFNCVIFVETYDYLTEQLENNVAEYMPAQSLTLEGSVVRNIYEEFCQDAADNTEVYISSPNYFVEMRNEINRLLRDS